MCLWMEGILTNNFSGSSYFSVWSQSTIVKSRSRDPFVSCLNILFEQASHSVALCGLLYCFVIQILKGVSAGTTQATITDHTRICNMSSPAPACTPNHHWLPGATPGSCLVLEDLQNMPLPLALGQKKILTYGSSGHKCRVIWSMRIVLSLI